MPMGTVKENIQNMQCKKNPTLNYYGQQLPIDHNTVYLVSAYSPKCDPDYTVCQKLVK